MSNCLLKKGNPIPFMKYWLAALAIISFISVAVFGFVALSNCHGETGLGCIASLAEGLFCPAGENTVISALFHANIYHGFSTAVLSASILIAALLLLGFLTLRFGSQFFSTTLLKYLPGQSGELAKLSFLVRQPRTNWLSLHEKRDPAF